MAMTGSRRGGTVTRARGARARTGAKRARGVARGCGGVPHVPNRLLVLDTLAAQPLWASWIGGSMRGAYAGPLFTVRNDDDEDTEIYAGTAGLVDMAALLAHVGAGDGRIIRVYNQVSGGSPAYLDAVDPAAGALCCQAGAQLTGTNGYLMASAIDGEGGYDGAFTLTGDAAVTLIGDTAEAGSNSRYFHAGVIYDDYWGAWEVQVSTSTPTDPTDYLQLATDSLNGSYPGFAWEDRAAGWSDGAGWFMYARAAGSQLLDSVYQWNGVTRSFSDSVGPTYVSDFSGTRLGWFSPTWGSGDCSASNMLVWSSVLSAADLAIVNAWEGEVYC